MSSYLLTETTYGFQWGPLKIERLLSDDGYGVLIKISTPRQKIEIRSTHTGLLRVGNVKKVNDDNI